MAMKHCFKFSIPSNYWAFPSLVCLEPSFEKSIQVNPVLVLTHLTCSDRTWLTTRDSHLRLVTLSYDRSMMVVWIDNSSKHNERITSWLCSEDITSWRREENNLNKLMIVDEIIMDSWSLPRELCNGWGRHMVICGMINPTH